MYMTGVENWRLRINYARSNVIHFHNKRKAPSNFAFRVEDQSAEYADVYRYLGIHMHDNLDFAEIAEILSQARDRALGAMISKVHSYKDIGYNIYAKLFNSRIVPVLDYCSGVWVFKSLNKIDDVQNRALRYFLGVHRFTPFWREMGGAMGWTLFLHRRWANMCRLRDRLINMDNNRFTRQLFDIDCSTSGKTWCSEIKSLFEQLNVTQTHVNKHAVDSEFVENASRRME